MSTLYARLLDAKSHLHMARIQRLPSDDNIIAEHIEDAERILGEALREIETTPPVVTHPRPSYHKQARGEPASLPKATLSALNGDDTPPEAA